jgi:hypothetical protein
VTPLAELAQLRRTALPSQIGWRGAGKDPGVEQPPDNESRRLRPAETHGGIEPVGHEVAETVAPHDFHRQLRICRQEFAEARGEHEACEEWVDIDPEPPTHHRS